MKKEEMWEGWQSWVKHFIFPFSQQNCWELVTYWLLGSDVSLCTTFLPLSFIFLFYLSLHHALSPCLVPNLSVQNRGSKVSQRTFPFLLMLQLFPGLFDNINCCPQCYWWADLSQSASAQLRPRRIKSLAEPRPIGPALIQGAKA